jgi:3',5'-cyclic-AMP phosphodiesterase
MIALPMAMERPFTIAHLSDLHCGSPYFVANLLERAIGEINEMQPDVVVCSGDLTTFGYKQEYAQARSYLDRLDCPDVITIPGNHDSRNVGYVHFEEMIGPRSTVLRKGGIAFVAIDSSEPDLDHGVVGRSSSGPTPTSACSCCTTTCCRSPAPAASETWCTTPATRWRCCSVRT